MLEDGLSRWKAQRPRHYRYSVAVYGGAAVRHPVEVEVRDGVGKATNPGQDVDDVATIDLVIDRCEALLEDRHDRASVDLDPLWGFPRSATMSTNMPEGDVHVEVRDFQVLP